MPIIMEDNMLLQWIHSWVSAGTHTAHLRHRPKNSVSSIYVTNLICLIVSFFLAIQVPFYIISALDSHLTKVNLILIHISALFLVPLFNGRQYYLAASFLFFCIYGSYIFLSSQLVNFQADTHLFFLLGLFVIPFIFPSHRRHLKIMLSSIYMAIFLVTELHLNDTFNDWDLFSGIKPTNRILFAIACFIAAYQVHRITTTSWNIENKERAKSESLLFNILPGKVIRALKQSRQTIAQYHANVTILFADIEGFTKLSSQLDPMILVNLLDELFSLFDEICAKYDLEKIKTLGDGYMAVGGLDTQEPSHSSNACLCAKEMRRAYLNFSHKHNLSQGIRIGLNTGAVVAGVIGKSKYTFDVWGEAVNLAARMQSHGETDKIQVSETTFAQTKKAFCFSPKRQLFIKGVGEKGTYWLID